MMLYDPKTPSYIFCCLSTLYQHCSSKLMFLSMYTNCEAFVFLNTSTAFFHLVCHYRGNRNLVWGMIGEIRLVIIKELMQISSQNLDLDCHDEIFKSEASLSLPLEIMITCLNMSYHITVGAVWKHQATVLSCYAETATSYFLLDVHFTD